MNDHQETPAESGTGVPHSTDWPHAPVHRLDGAGVFMVTAGTYQKQQFFDTPAKRDLVLSSLLSLAKQYDWQVEAWVVLSNHYHFIGRSPGAGSSSLRGFIKHLHVQTARAVNAMDHVTNRKVWFNYWDTQLTYERSYLARLNYVHQNAVHHGLVEAANQYPWCSAAWFERVTPPAMVKTIYTFKTDHVSVPDDF